MIDLNYVQSRFIKEGMSSLLINSLEAPQAPAVPSSLLGALSALRREGLYSVLGHVVSPAVAVGDAFDHALRSKGLAPVNCC